MTDINKEFVQDIKNAWKMKFPLDDIQLKLARRKTNKLDINYSDSTNIWSIDSNTPLMMAINQYEEDPETYMKISQLLIDAGADINLKYDNNSTPLMEAVECGAEDLCKLLIKKGADINAVNKYGLTALMRAVNNNTIELCQILLQYNPDVTICDEDGNTALTLSKKYPKIHQLILDYSTQSKIPVKSVTKKAPIKLSEKVSPKPTSKKITVKKITKKESTDTTKNNQ